MSKPDYQRAQQMIREAMMAAAKECGFKDEFAEFVVVMAGCYSAVATELVPSPFLMEDGGVDRAVAMFTDSVRDMLRTDMRERVRTERLEARH